MAGLIRVVRFVVAGVLLGAQVLLFALPVAAAQAEIVSAGPLTRIITTTDLNCQVAHRDDADFEFYDPDDTAGSCGTFLAVGGSLYGPAFVPSGSFGIPQIAFTSVGQSGVGGTGSAADPFRVVTTVDATGTGLRIEQTDSYVLGTQSYRTDIKITNLGPTAQAGALYRAGDCYLQESDQGFGRVDNGAPACVVTRESNSRIEQWTPLTPGSHFIEADYVTVYQQVNGQQFPDTCACDFAFDNGAGLSWPVNIAPGQSVTYSHEMYFSPVGRAPVTQSFTSSVPDPTQLTLDPVVVAQTVAVTAGVILLVPFPSALFNSTLEENYEEVMAGVAAIRRRLRALWSAIVGRIRRAIEGRRSAQPMPGAGNGPIAPAAPPAWDSSPLGGPAMAPRATAMVQPSVPTEAALAVPPTADRPAGDIWRKPLGILGFVLVSALFYAFLDPTFGFSLVSLATLLGLVIGLMVILVAYGAPLVLFSRSHSIGLTVRALPATLLIAVLCVVVSRLSDFQPGYLYGLVIGFFFVHGVSRDVEGRAEAAAAGTSLAAAFVAWVGLALLRSGIGPSGEFAGALLEAATVTVVVAGLENAVFQMLPLRFLPGAAVYAWSRRIWLVLIGLGIFGFAHVLLNPSAGAGYLADTSRTSFFTLVLLLVAFGLASVLFWAWFRFRPSSMAHPQGPAL